MYVYMIVFNVTQFSYFNLPNNKVMWTFLNKMIMEGVKNLIMKLPSDTCIMFYQCQNNYGRKY